MSKAQIKENWCPYKKKRHQECMCIEERPCEDTLNQKRTLTDANTTGNWILAFQSQNCRK